MKNPDKPFKLILRILGTFLVLLWGSYVRANRGFFQMVRRYFSMCHYFKRLCQPRSCFQGWEFTVHYTQQHTLLDLTRFRRFANVTTSLLSPSPSYFTDSHFTLFYPSSNPNRICDELIFRLIRFSYRELIFYLVTTL